MANPQDPGLRRSERGSTVEDSAKAKADHVLQDGDDGVGWVPEANRPGHRPEHDEDKPNDAAFVAEWSMPPQDQESR